MQHKTESKDCLIDNENCENIRNDSNPIIKPRRNSILIQPEDLDLYYKDGYEDGKQTNNIFTRHKILVSLVIVFLAVSSVIAIIVVKQSGFKHSGLLLPQSGSWSGYYIHDEVSYDLKMEMNFWRNGSLFGTGKVGGSKDILDIIGQWNNQGITFREHKSSSRNVKYTGRAHFNDMSNLDGRWSNNHLDLMFHLSYDKN